MAARPMGRRKRWAQLAASHFASGQRSRKSSVSELLVFRPCFGLQQIAGWCGGVGGSAASQRSASGSLGAQFWSSLGGCKASFQPQFERWGGRACINGWPRGAAPLLCGGAKELVTRLPLRGCLRWHRKWRCGGKSSRGAVCQRASGGCLGWRQPPSSGWRLVIFAAEDGNFIPTPFC